MKIIIIVLLTLKMADETKNFKVITITLDKTIQGKIEDFQRRFTRNGKKYSFSGALNRLLEYGIKSFEEKKQTQLKNVKIKTEEEEDDTKTTKSKMEES